jgi:hypothetical protein
VRQYFEFAPRERKPRHGLLQSQAKYFPRVLFRLKALEPGLNTELVKAKSDEPLIAELAGYCAELFLLKPCMRAQRRREIVSDLRSRMTEYQRAAARLLKRYPDIAALAPDLIPPLASHFKLIRKAARRRTQAAIVRIKRPPMKKTSGLPWIAVVAIVATTSAISRWSSNQSDNYPYQAPNYQYQAPTYSLRDIHVPVFTPSPSPQQPGDQRLIQDGGTVVGRLLEDRRNGTLKAEGDTDSVETSQGTMILRKGKTGFTIERGGPPGQDAKLPSALRPSPPSAGGRKSP